MTQYLDRLARELRAVVSQRPAPAELGEAVSRLIMPWIPHDGSCLQGMHPMTAIGSFAFAHRLNGEYNRVRTHEIYLGNAPGRPDNLARDRVPVHLVDAGQTRRLPDGTRKLLVRHGMSGDLRVVLRSAHGVWGMLCLQREGRGRSFGAADVERVTHLIPPLAAMLRDYVMTGPLIPAGPALSPGVIVVRGDNTVRSVTTEAAAWMRELYPGGRPPEAAAAEYAYSVSLAARARLRDPQALQPLTCTPSAYCGRWVTGHAQPLDEQATGEVAVIVQAAGGPLLLATLAAWYGITARERQVVEHLCAGEAPKRIARRLDVSVNTVNGHVREVYRKTGLAGRDELAAVIAG
ncbi:helix-turn-helix transcriptional regulator [Amycolatopsis nigrescens]|uniref:helix-turn-helix transcriptional regulator n=1 Tax=Amycolatopsis nigrescens TaxID=381445 RepID=UPI000368FC41|nr:helix-turn-helix transcriptional regulator [Amycolatopsis nigrescens]